MIGRRIAIVMFPLLVQVSLTAEAAYFKPAPEDFVEGVALSIPDLNLYVEAPSAEWEWLVASETLGVGENELHLFACDLYGLRQIYVTVSEPCYPVTAKGVSRIIDELAVEFEKEGYVSSAVSPVQSDIPFPGAYRFKISGENKLGARRYIYGYNASRGRAFTFMYRTVEDSEPLEFTNLVRSFRTTGALPDVPLDAQRSAHGLLAVAIVFVVGLVGWIINKASGRLVFNQWKAALLLLFVAGFVLTALWFPKVQGPEALGRFIGGAIAAPFFLPVLFAVWRLKVVERRRSGELEEKRSPENGP